MSRTFSHIGVLAALQRELGPFGAPELPVGEVFGCRVREAPPRDGFRITAAEAGVGKVAAARGALALVAQGADLILVVGTCGGLLPGDRVGDLVHLRGSTQWDLGVRDGRESRADGEVFALWQRAAPGAGGHALTADRPAIRLLSRWRRARARGSLRALDPGGPPGTVVADMETAAVAAIADRAGVPWAGLRVISDQRRSLPAVVFRRNREAGSFAANFERHASRPADSIGALLACLRSRP